MVKKDNVTILVLMALLAVSFLIGLRFSYEIGFVSGAEKVCDEDVMQDSYGEYYCDDLKKYQGFTGDNYEPVAWGGLE